MVRNNHEHGRLMKTLMLVKDESMRTSHEELNQSDFMRVQCMDSNRMNYEKINTHRIKTNPD